MADPDARRRAEEYLRLWGHNESEGIKIMRALLARIVELESLLRECNAVCLCGCPASEHESYGEDGESCADEGHECIRVAPAVLDYVNRLRSRALPPEVEAAAEDVVRGDWWGHYCPSCGSTFKHGPECRIGRLAKALSSARAAKGGAE